LAFYLFHVSILNAVITTVIWFQIHSINICGTLRLRSHQHWWAELLVVLTDN